MQSSINQMFKHFDQCDQIPDTFTQLPATLKAADCQAAVSQPFPSFTHLPRGPVPEFASASHSTGYCLSSPALAAVLAIRKKLLFSNNPCYKNGYHRSFL